MNKASISAGAVLVQALLNHQVRQVFCVPGESYLAVLDALYDVQDSIQVISCRHESGAAMMALANARLRHRAGVCLVTRGPGATNAAIAVHIAQQASIPLVLVVGQVPRGHLGREAFQEVDYTRFFAPLCKHVEQAETPDTVSDAMTRAFSIAESGRPGPVAVAIPEDVLLADTQALATSPIAAPRTGIADNDLGQLKSHLAAAKRPLIIAGGGQWTDQAAACLEQFATTNSIPVCTSFRRHDLIDNHSECFAGYLGYGSHAEIWPAVAEADCVIVIGARLDEPTTQSYTLFRGATTPALIHLYPNSAEIGLNYPVTLGLVTDVELAAAQLAKLGRVVRTDCSAWRARLRKTWLDDAAPPPCDAALDPGQLMACLNARLDDNAIITVDAGNFSRWPQRYRHYRRPGRLLAPINGAMGFGVPAAVGAALTHPERQVVACVGDGGMLMTGQELATAALYGARPLILVFNNNRYGTIEMHQDQRYPGRHLATTLSNPDFAALARSFGLHGARIERNAEIEPALDEAFKAPTAALLELAIEGY